MKRKHTRFNQHKLKRNKREPEHKSILVFGSQKLFDSWDKFLEDFLNEKLKEK